MSFPRHAGGNHEPTDAENPHRKYIFHVHGRDAAGKPVLQERFSIVTLLKYMVYLSLPCGDGSVRGSELLKLTFPRKATAHLG